MSSSEPTRPILGKGLSHDTRAAREELEGQKKIKAVEKIGEISDEQRTRQKFRQFMGDAENAEANTAPSPFEVIFNEKTTNTTPMPLSETAAPTPTPDLGDVEDAIVASPSYVLPSDIPQMQSIDDDEEEEEPTTSLPQSDDFWQDVDLPPDQPLQQPNLQQAPTNQVFGQQSQPQGTEGAKKPAGKKGQKEEAPLYGLPGQPILSETAPTYPKKEVGPTKTTGKTPPLPSPFETAANIASKGKTPVKKSALEEGEAMTVAPPIGRMMTSEEAKAGKKDSATEKQKAEEERRAGVVPESTRLRSEEREGGKEGRKGRDQKGTEILAPSLPLLSASITPFATAAATAASSYLHPTTISLFFQMVGTMYMMSAPPGISRTEIVLNNPAFSNSKFYGATITLEKYATAPDSFNIRLTGSDAAVTAFRDNIPSLIAAFQNSNLPFRIGRVEAQYSIERPVFRRKEPGEERGGSGTDLGHGKGGKK